MIVLHPISAEVFRPA